MKGKQDHRFGMFSIVLILTGVLFCLAALRFTPAGAGAGSLPAAQSNRQPVAPADSERSARSRFSTLYDRFGQDPIKVPDPLTPLSPQTPGISFTAVTYTGFATPDPAIGVGLTQICVVVNGRIRTFTKTGMKDGALDEPTDN
ncbi:MAG: hypothetical protein DMF74_27440, partial [Acidobacteria bacterium]